MRVIRSAADPGVTRSVVTVGTFDGVHLAHRAIIRHMQRDAERLNAQTCVVTFDPHPQQVLHSRPHDVRLLTTVDERLALLDEAGVNVAAVLAFTKEFSQTPPEEFVREVLVRRLGAAHVMVGHDHGFGKGRAGDIELLEQIGREHGFTVEAMDALVIDGAPVSSTRIRRLLEAGAVDEARRLLGRPHAITGTVVQGDRLGTKIGFPTANIAIADPAKLVPADGVYAVRVVHNGARYGGMMNIGVRPTVSAGLRHTVEVNIFAFSQQIYGDTLTVEFAARVRDERKFGSLEELIAQLERDRQTSFDLLANTEHTSLTVENHATDERTRPGDHH